RTGDTVLSGALRRFAAGLRPEVALVHVGAVRFGISGPLRYTMNAEEAVELLQLARPDVAAPIHVEGWSHFSQQEEAARFVFAGGPAEVAASVRWLPLGETTDL